MGPGLLAGLFLVVLGTLLWLMNDREFRREHVDLLDSARAAREGLRRPLEATRNFLAIQAEDIARNAIDASLFDRRLGDYVDDHPELAGVAYVDRDGSVLWVAPASARAVLIGLDFAGGSPRDAWQEARRLRQAVYSQPYVMAHGESAMALCVPVFRGQEFLGAVVGVCGLERLLRSSLTREVTQKHQVSLLQAGGERLVALPAMEEVDGRLTYKMPLDLPASGLMLRLDRYGSGFWGMGLQLLILLCVALVLGMAMGMWMLGQQVARRARAEEELRKARDELEVRVQQRTADLERANQQLQHEIVERQRAEEQARQHQNQLAHVARMRTMGEMAAGLAHELNQPLGAISSYAEGCVRLIESNQAQTPELSSTLEEVSRQARRAGRIIHRLREFYRDGQAQRAPSSLHRLSAEIIDLLAAEIRQNQVQVRNEIPEDLAEMPLDRIQIQQVMLNMMRNAIEAMGQTPPAERELVLRACKSDEQTVQVSVADTGSGCPGEDLPRIFEPFFTTKTQGMGMGLSISRTIIEAHGGRLWALPNRPRGLILLFTLQIPREEGP